MDHFSGQRGLHELESVVGFVGPLNLERSLPLDLWEGVGRSGERLRGGNNRRDDVPGCSFPGYRGRQGRRSGGGGGFLREGRSRFRFGGDGERESCLG